MIMMTGGSEPHMGEKSQEGPCPDAHIHAPQAPGGQRTGGERLHSLSLPLLLLPAAARQAWAHAVVPAGAIKVREVETHPQGQPWQGWRLGGWRGQEP